MEYEYSISLFNIFTSTICPFFVIIPSLIALLVADVDLLILPVRSLKLGLEKTENTKYNKIK